ncbi:MAG: hypothetical protein RMJ48_12160 [Roseiflexaceae bacterium]|nr:hypothetical protein [Roseiflexus sp.]MDW8147024.1 hypothetical protein [Roseiflexaceae bacterium]
MGHFPGKRLFRTERRPENCPTTCIFMDCLKTGRRRWCACDRCWHLIGCTIAEQHATVACKPAVIALALARAALGLLAS